MEEKKVEVKQEKREYRLKNERSTVVTIVTAQGDLILQPFATEKVTKAIADAPHVADLRAQGVIRLSIN